MICHLTQSTQVALMITTTGLAQTPNTAPSTTLQVSLARKLKWKPVEGCRPWGLHWGKSGFVSNYVRGLQLPCEPPGQRRRHHRSTDAFSTSRYSGMRRSTARSCLATKGECGNSLKTAADLARSSSQRCTCSAHARSHGRRTASPIPLGLICCLVSVPQSVGGLSRVDCSRSPHQPYRTRKRFFANKTLTG
ncbi:hypothetical protein B0T18DRAFT_57841 [Schizothecium vesticola]|uniref:Uncharacterized protein n=1 Tax=Schizothecium vesticola TaxID=314040 RepID=A0AA40K9L3_9PEZI|nr:hypothetical protein B0T18DRAFT_57841 [Schizothecium vesticola]